MVDIRVCLSDRVSRQGFAKNRTLNLHPKKGSRGKSRCYDPEIGACSISSRNSREASVAIAEDQGECVRR